MICSSTLFVYIKDIQPIFNWVLHLYSFYILQLVEIVLENGPDVLGIPLELKKDLLLNLHEASSAMDPPEDWEGVAPDQLLLQLASAWEIELQQFEK